ncbi:hypothetical protein [Peribacillus simplex]|uniref:hypothetical protein n=1 Tax=Peribacillus simplex TaxID=1478 RepID=UPI0024C19ED0|nr:hypothetical protein [Peribacillus simplex]WHX92025.1 hypothetical protein QNH50_03845 [Peribacillus simplex]
MGVKTKIEEWLEELREEKKEIESRMAQAKVNVEVAQVKFSIAYDAQGKVSQSGKEDFYNMYMKNLEDNRNSLVDNYEKIKENNTKELKYVNVMIEQVERAVKDLDN